MSFRRSTLQIVRGSLLSVSRVAFADGPLCGCLILLSIAVLSPGAAILGLLGAVTGTVLNYLFERETGKWVSGAAGVKPRDLWNHMGSTNFRIFTILRHIHYFFHRLLSCRATYRGCFSALFLTFVSVTGPALHLVLRVRFLGFW